MGGQESPCPVFKKKLRRRKACSGRMPGTEVLLHVLPGGILFQVVDQIGQPLQTGSKGHTGVMCQLLISFSPMPIFPSHTRVGSLTTLLDRTSEIP